MAAFKETQIKGMALAGIPVFIKERFGPDGLDRWLFRLSPEVRATVSKPIPVSIWFPISMSNDAHKVLNELFFNGTTKGSFELGRFNAKRAMKGIYSGFLKMFSKKFPLKLFGSVFKMYYSNGSLISESAGEREARIKIMDFPDLPQTIEEAIIGYLTGGLEMAGCKELRTVIKSSVYNGDPNTEFIISWD